ncbi:hypothetical protein [Pedobacter cryoconitis]|uniref:Uncharacterized protein n=1 Tax=Pedobacter cryoconitis TaxID=188932 RepID=A0A327RZH2_9SPHI|nr:hypothetical protein [Pedobacter cryoconitis]RAJ21174.1 hypothetical protein LY11_05015 [Pedobacter cryoconitis]
MINSGSKADKTKTGQVNKVKAADTPEDLEKYREADNLGLDADGSSVNPGRTNYNNDNDRISHNPDGEDDSHDTRESPGNSPLMDK